VDVFEPGQGPQLHDLNPTVFPPYSLFWTVLLPDHSVDVNPSKGRAVMNAVDVPIFDYHDIPNAVFGDGAPIPTPNPAPVPGTVSFTVAWSGVNERVNIKNTDPVYGGFGGEFVRGNAQMEWSASVGDFQFVSAPLETSYSIFAEVGKERNGIFFNK